MSLSGAIEEIDDVEVIGPEVSESVLSPSERIRMGAKVLTGASNDFGVEKELRSSFIALDDGWIFVAHGQNLDLRIASVEARLRRAMPTTEWQRALVSQADLEEAYGIGLEESVRHGAEVSGKARDEALRLLHVGAEMRASDIEVHVEIDKATVSMRVDGDWRQYTRFTVEHGNQVCRAIYGLCDVAEKTDSITKQTPASINGGTGPNQVRLPKGVSGVRVQFNPTDGIGRDVVIRLAYVHTDIGLEKLGFSEAQLNEWQLLRRLNGGVVVISGPTGSGKTTALYGNLLRTQVEYPGKKIRTVEDPPEGRLPGIVQTAVRNASGSDERGEAFKEAFRAAMRSAPDVIMWGEVRDGEGGDMSIMAARSGHLIWTTVHADNALQILPQLRDLGVVSSGLFDPGVIAGLVSMRLVKTICPHCGQRMTEQNVPAEVWRWVSELGLVGRVKARSASGCDKCRFTGAGGRTAIAEIIRPDYDFMELMKANKQPEARLHWMNKLNGRTLTAHGLDKVARGLVDIRDLQSVVNAAELDSKLMEKLGDKTDFH